MKSYSFLDNVYNNLLAKALNFAENEKKNKGLKSPHLVANITSRCNFGCPHCIRKKMDKNKKIREDISILEFETFLKESKKLNAKSISLTGGEPILHPYFEDLLKIIKAFDYKFIIVSNGWIKNKYLKLINKYRDNFFQMALSLDGATPSVHDMIRNMPGSFDKVISAIRLFIKNEIDILVTICLGKRNFNQLEDIMELCLRLKVPYVKVTCNFPMEGDNDVLDESEKITIIEKINEFNAKQIKSYFSYSINVAPLKKQEFNFCPILNGSEIFLNFDGSMAICCDFPKIVESNFHIGKDGFEKCFSAIIDADNELKKLRMKKILKGEGQDYNCCSFCNKYGENCLETAIEKNKNR